MTIKIYLFYTIVNPAGGEWFETGLGISRTVT
jgi:hypothetical protein